MINKTYRTELHKEIEDLGLYSKLKKEGFVKLNKGFYKSAVLAQILYSVLHNKKYVIEEMINSDMYNNNMEEFAKGVKRTRQAVRMAIIQRKKYIVLKQGKYDIKGLYGFLIK